MSTATPGATTGRHPAELLALGFGAVVAMWAIGYVGRLPAVAAPSPLLLLLFVICQLSGGYLAGRLTDRGWLGGAQVGLVSGLVNLLVLGAFLGGGDDGDLAPSAAIFVPGFVALSAMLGALGALGGGAVRRRPRGAEAWVAVFAAVAVLATLLLLAVGGLVTSHEAGLAVVDWPNSYGYNMFLFPLARMTGGIYYEHAHRLFGALVGLTTLVLAVLLQAVDRRPAVRRLGWLALALVIAQGILGGLRVTGHFTLSTSPDEVAPNVVLAVVHGALAQVFLAILVGLAVMTSPSWRRARPAPPRPTASTDRTLAGLLIAVLLVQIVLGAVQRHLASGLLIHISMAAVVTLCAVAAGARAWGLNRGIRVLQGLGHAVMDLTLLQLVLGTAAFVATGGFGGEGSGSLFEVSAATLHQWCGALLLASAVMLTLWTWRLFPRRQEAPASGS